MPAPAKWTRLETEAIVLGYAMSRLDAHYLTSRHCATWQDAFAQAAAALSEPAASFKNLRDEFDPVHGNSRLGWHKRPLRPSRQRVLDELAGVSDDALQELVNRILSRDSQGTAEAIDSLAVVTGVAINVAERLLTGRRAEEYFLEHSQDLVRVATDDIEDLRQSALGFDFGVRGRPDLAIEVKGLKRSRGDIQFTDREWSEAGHRLANYWLVVVGNLADQPTARVIRDPRNTISAECKYQRSLTAVWRSRVSVSM